MSYDRILKEAGQRCRALRILRGLKQGDLARRAGVGVATVHRFERSGHASFENVVRIATALGAEEAFAALFAAPKYQSLDDALAREELPERQRVRGPRK